MGLLDYTVRRIGATIRDRTEPAPPPVPGIIPGADKRYGSPIPLVLGRGVVSGQLVYQGVPTSGSGYVWDGVAWAVRGAVLGVDVVLALCEAPVDSVVRCYRRGGTSQVMIDAIDFLNRIALSGGSVTAITAATATAWSGYVGTAYEGMAHSGTCHVRVTKAMLEDDGSFPDTKWEVAGATTANGGCVTTVSTPDAEAADMLVFLLCNTIHGLGFDAGLVNVELGADGLIVSSYRRYCRARGFHLSRVIERGDSIANIIEELLAATNSTLVWIDGVLKAIPLDDEASYTSTFWPGHGTYPYTPATSSTAIGDADFADPSEPVRVEREPRSRVFSVYPVDYTLRKDDSGKITYATNHAEYQSDVWSNANGLRRAETLDLTPWVLSEQHAWFVTYLTAQRAMHHRARYMFRVKPKHSILAPGDFVDLTDSQLGISAVKCRVETTEEDERGEIEITALEWPLGTTKAFTLPTTAPAGRQSDGVARKLVQPDMIASESITLTAGTGWTLTYASTRKVGSIIFGTVHLTAGASAAWASMFTLPAGARPLADVFASGRVLDSSGPDRFPAIFYIDTGGVCQLNYYDNGATYAIPFTIGTDDTATFSFVLACF